MSHKLVNHLKFLSGLTFAQKSVLYRLCDESRDGETVFLKMERLAEYAGCSERAAQYAIQQLIKLKVLTPVGTARGRGHPHTYHISLDALSGLKKPERKRASRKVEKPPVSAQTTKDTTPPQKEAPGVEARAEKGNLNGHSPSPPTPDVQEAGKLTPEQLQKRHEDAKRLKALLRSGAHSMEGATYDERWRKTQEDIRRYEERMEQALKELQEQQ